MFRKVYLNDWIEISDRIWKFNDYSDSLGSKLLHSLGSKLVAIIVVIFCIINLFPGYCNHHILMFSIIFEKLGFFFCILTSVVRNRFKRFKLSILQNSKIQSRRSRLLGVNFLTVFYIISLFLEYCNHYFSYFLQFSKNFDFFTWVSTLYSAKKVQIIHMKYLTEFKNF